MITKPMLAGKPPPLAALTYPVLATPKLDGIRCLVIGKKALTRSFKPIPNDYIRQTIEMTLNSHQLDGEIMVKGRTFNELSGDVRRQDGRPDFYYAVFDVIGYDGFASLREPYALRVVNLQKLILPPFVQKIIPKIINSVEELNSYEAECILSGYEGVCIRSPNSPYKCGRSTTSEGYLLKIKQFEDGEAEVIAVEEMMHNDNPATRDAFGRTERSSHKENLRPAGTMGRLVVRDVKTKIEFEIGTGFTEGDRAKIWANREKIVADKLIAKYKHQPCGAKDKPRCPVFLGWRDKWDM